MHKPFRKRVGVGLMAFILFSFFSGCKEPASVVHYSKISGLTMGTQYNITYSSEQNHQQAIDSLLVALNDEVSTYIETSKISLFNKSAAGICLKDKVANSAHFLKIFESAQLISNATKGAFDPSIMPLVNFWGFGYTEKKAQKDVDPQALDKIRSLVGMHNINLAKSSSVSEECLLFLNKNDQQIELDFSAIAKGYGVDILAEYFDELSIPNYLIEIGGELRAKGLSPSKQKWKIGINKPDPKSTVNEFHTIVHLTDIAMASSGNYRIYHEVDGKKYGHEINPKTGYPEKNEVLSVTVMDRKCTSADAYATAFMIMGKAPALAFCEATPDLDVYIIYGDKDGGISSTYSAGFRQYLKHK